MLCGPPRLLPAWPAAWALGAVTTTFLPGARQSCAPDTTAMLEGTLPFVPCQQWAPQGSSLRECREMRPRAGDAGMEASYRGGQGRAVALPRASEQ